jgi:putative flippase GtrA
MINLFFTRQFITFLITGGIAASVNFLARIFFNQWLDFSTSIILAYLIGMGAAFILARCFVFSKSKKTLSHSIFLFSTVNIFAVLQTWGISLIFADKLLPIFSVTNYKYEIAHGIGIMAPVFTSYLGHKYFSFK